MPTINLAVSRIIETDWVWAAAHRKQYDSGFCNGSITRSDRSGQPQRIISHDSGYSCCLLKFP